MGWKRELKEVAGVTEKFVGQDVRRNARAGLAPLSTSEWIMIALLMIGGLFVWLYIFGSNPESATAGASTLDGTTADSGGNSFIGPFMKLIFFVFLVFVPPFVYMINFRWHRFKVHTQVDGITRYGGHFRRKL